MSAAKEAKARRSRLKRPSKAKLSLLKQVLVKNCFSKQKMFPRKDPHLKTDSGGAIQSIFGSSFQPLEEIKNLSCWPKKSLETIFASPFQPVGFAFKQGKSPLFSANQPAHHLPEEEEAQLAHLPEEEEELSFTTLEAAELDAWDESWDRTWAQQQLTDADWFKASAKMFSLQENQDESGGEDQDHCQDQDQDQDQEEGFSKIQPSSFSNFLDIPILGGVNDKELDEYKEKMDKYEQQMIKNKTNLENHFYDVNFS